MHISILPHNQAFQAHLRIYVATDHGFAKQKQNKTNPHATSKVYQVCHHRRGHPTTATGMLFRSLCRSFTP